MKLDLRFSVSGRARYLSHLETVDTLLAAFRRVGLEVALSQGMRPKPVISLAVPRAVGVESEEEIATLVLVAEPVGDEAAWCAAIVERLNATLPRGLHVLAAQRTERKPIVVAVRYRVTLAADPATVAAACTAFAALDAAPVVRRNPKGERTVDVRRTCDAAAPVAGGVAFEIAVRDDGFARPEEVVRALADAVSQPLEANAVVRTQIVTAAAPVGAAVQMESTI